VPYGDEDALRFREELEASRRELEDVSKKAVLAELEWEDQRKQLLEAIDGTALRLILDPARLLMLIFFFLLPAARDAELNQLKTLVEQLAEKVNARGDTPAERLAAVEHRVDEVATHGVRLGTTLGLAAGAARRRTSTRSSSSWSPRWPRRRHCRNYSSPICVE
jgi:hypothetical protein